MYCNDQQELITFFIDGELAIPEQIELFKHLAVCSDCQSFIDTMMRMREIEKREQIRCPSEVDEAILFRLSQRDRSDIFGDSVKKKTGIFKISRRITLPLPVAVGAAVAAIVIGFFLSGILYRGAEPATFPATLTQQQTQPAAVIFIYGMPPMEVISTAMVQTLNNNNKQIY